MSYSIILPELVNVESALRPLCQQAAFLKELQDQFRDNNPATAGAPVQGSMRALKLTLQQHFYVLFEFVDGVVRIIAVALKMPKL